MPKFKFTVELETADGHDAWIRSQTIATQCRVKVGKVTKVRGLLGPRQKWRVLGSNGLEYTVPCTKTYCTDLAKKMNRRRIHDSDTFFRVVPDAPVF